MSSCIWMQRLLGGERWRPGPRYGRLDTANGDDTPPDTPHNVVLLTAAFLAVVDAVYFNRGSRALLDCLRVDREKRAGR